MWFRVSIIMLLFAVSSCVEFSEPNNDLRYRKNPPLSPPPLKEEKTLIFGVLASDLGVDLADFNRWATLKKTKDHVHIFARNPAPFTLFQGIKHQASEENLSEKMAEVLAKSTATRLVIFIATHGEASLGNWCLDNQFECALTEDSLIDMLNKHAEVSPQSLREILVVPLSCYSKPIMDRFGAKIKERSWPFEVSYLAQSVNETNYPDSPAESLLQNLLVPYAAVNDAQLERFFSLTSINEFVSFNNSLMTPEAAKARMEIHSSSILSLGDFGFNLGIMLPFHRSAASQVPFERSVKEVLKSLPLGTKFYPFIDELRFRLEDIKHEDYSFKVEGDITKKIIDSRYKNRIYKNFSVVLRINDK